MRSLLAASLVVSFVLPAFAAEPFIPRRQSKPPGPPKSPQEAIAAMTVPEGFSVELVAAEPDLVNPVAMTIDERGRFWVCESVEYPRHEPGPGRDRIKVLEDTDGDGKVDKNWIFADGLNIPSGIAVGHGGVWVANAPDILFLQDTDGDGKADKREVVVTGFGRFDTHELPNSLTWGPDGWLYGLNGVFNPAKVEQEGRKYDFTCAVFRIHPVTRRFELFAEGTSNPWGIAFDPEGALFVSACVIDHFWHLTETGYYRRQGGPYPPHTWVLESIVDHGHQMAAYCGLHYCDSDAFPPEWRNVFLMGNIHGNCINADVVERRGSTYAGKPRQDFLSANDVWFMTVEQMTGPDGSLYVLDWYDRYHCYQDAQADAPGIDRLHGRLYRVRYKETPYLPVGFDLAIESDEKLIERLDGGNDFLRSTACRLLAERLLAKSAKRESPADQETFDGRVPLDFKEIRDELWEAARRGPSKVARMNALWALASGDALEGFMFEALFDEKDPSFRAWGVRAAGQKIESRGHLLGGQPLLPNGSRLSIRGLEKVPERILALASDPSPDVQLQVAIAAPKLPDVDVTRALFDVLMKAGDDPLIPGIVWQNLSARIEESSPELAGTFLDLVAVVSPSDRSNALKSVLPRIGDRLLSSPNPDAELVARVVTLLAESDGEAAGRVLRTLAKRYATGEIGRGPKNNFRATFEPLVASLLRKNGPYGRDAALLGAALGDANARAMTERLFADGKAGTNDRLAAAEVLVSVGEADAIAKLVADPSSGAPEFRGGLLAVLGRSESPAVAESVLAAYGRLEPELKPRAIELLAQRPAWGAKLVAAIEAGTISKDAVNVNQVRALVGSDDDSLAKRATAIWGTVREGRSPEREQVIAEVRKRLERTPADAAKGQVVFTKVCGQCHKIYGQGEEVGPDVTRNGRNDYAQLLSNVLDPSLVIGAGYQAHTVVTSDGRVLSGLVVEDTPQRLVLKLQGGKTEAIPRDEVEQDSVSEVSLMPEGLERQLTPQELADLFAFLSLDKPPGDPEAQRLSGAPGQRER